MRAKICVAKNGNWDTIHEVDFDRIPCIGESFKLSGNDIYLVRAIRTYHFDQKHQSYCNLYVTKDDAEVLFKLMQSL